MDYLDLDLDLRDAGDALHGQMHCTSLSPSSERKILLPWKGQELEAVVDGIGRIGRNPEPENDLPWLKKVGSRLYTALFSDEWQQYAHRAMLLSQQGGLGLRLNICAQGGMAEETPWELLYDSLSDQFIGCSLRTVIVRTTRDYLHEKRYLASAGQDVRILVATASPVDIGTAHIDLDSKAIEQRLSTLPETTVRIYSADRVSWDAFQKELLTKKPHILHMVAHGSDQQVVFEEGGRSDKVEYSSVSALLAGVQGLRIVVFNVCDSGHLLGRKGPFGTLPEIPSATGVWALLVTRATISSSASISFTRSLYTALAAGNSLTYAVAFARNSLAGTATREAVQWSIPMYYQACDVIPFPPLISPPRWASAPPPMFEDVLELRQKVGTALKQLSMLRAMVNHDPTPSPQLLQELNIEPTLIEEVQRALRDMEYPHDLTRWMTDARDLANETRKSFESCAQLISSMAELSNDSRGYRERLHRARRACLLAHQQGEGLGIHFEQLLPSLQQ